MWAKVLDGLWMGFQCALDELFEVVLTLCCMRPPSKTPAKAQQSSTRFKSASPRGYPLGVKPSLKSPNIARLGIGSYWIV